MNPIDRYECAHLIRQINTCLNEDDPVLSRMLLEEFKAVLILLQKEGIDNVRGTDTGFS